MIIQHHLVGIQQQLKVGFTEPLTEFTTLTNKKKEKEKRSI